MRLLDRDVWGNGVTGKTVKGVNPIFVSNKRKTIGYCVHENGRIY